MESIGIRELRQNASVWLRRVEQGESFQVTDRGRPVAMLVPPPKDRLAELRAQGVLRPAVGNLLELAAKAQPPSGPLSASEALEMLRADER
jgi:prevent-host-death family protein